MTKKLTERRKPARRAGAQSSAKNARSIRPETLGKCAHCEEIFKKDQKYFYVEEENQRKFCSEACITHYFRPESEELERVYLSLDRDGDLTSDQHEEFAHLKWLALEEPQEVWKQRTRRGDLRSNMIREFRVDEVDFPIYAVCCCLTLKKDPSFLFMAFLTKHAHVVDAFRIGALADREMSDVEDVLEKRSDRLAKDWTIADSRIAALRQSRSESDIPVEDFSDYNSLFHQTLEAPDEVWIVNGEKKPENSETSEISDSEAASESAYEVQEDSKQRILHFIKRDPRKDPPTWFVIVGREVSEGEEMEVLEAFPTRDQALAERYRIGEQESGEPVKSAASSRLVH